MLIRTEMWDETLLSGSGHDKITTHKWKRFARNSNSSNQSSVLGIELGKRAERDTIKDLRSTKKKARVNKATDLTSSTLGVGDGDQGTKIEGIVVGKATNDELEANKGRGGVSKLRREVRETNGLGISDKVSFATITSHQGALGNGRSGRGKEVGGDRWRPPDQGLLKINCNTSFDKGKRRIGFGSIIRNANGKVVACCSEVCEAILMLTLPRPWLSGRIGDVEYVNGRDGFDSVDGGVIDDYVLGLILLMMSNTSISGSSSPFSNYQRRRLPAKVAALSTANRDHSNGSVLLDTRSGTTTLQEMRDGYAEVVDPKSGVVGGVQDVYGEDTATEDQPVTPWAVSVASGYSLLRDPHHNKGLAFNEKERDSHYLCGLLPPTVVSQELQVSFFLPPLSLFQSLGLSDL
ncbi:hypothetical protein EZV62_003780 [Acer yangbiense]|uniref:Uncharacterized protein n=1 Tax=Acer yangbiense TaxID=1000413 RepID=A0A5C7IID3_9ROSI|nr:hypothetical protein EZV62_003780 [Acer yangbiense]